MIDSYISGERLLLVVSCIDKSFGSLKPMKFYQHIQALNDRYEKNFCSIFLEISILHNSQLVEILWGIILHSSPILECIHRKLYCHNAVVNIVSVIDFCSDDDFLESYRIKSFQLIQDLRFEFILRLLPYNPMLRCIKRV